MAKWISRNGKWERVIEEKPKEVAKESLQPDINQEISAKKEAIEKVKTEDIKVDIDGDNVPDVIIKKKRGRKPKING